MQQKVVNLNCDANALSANRNDLVRHYAALLDHQLDARRETVTEALRAHVVEALVSMFA